jgi:hypothetical protein
MIRPVAIFLLAAAIAAPATAGSDVLEPAFGNTLEMTYPDGALAKLWLNRDGSYRGQNRRGRASAGKWFVRDAKLCMKQARPMPMPVTYCTPIIPGGVGAAWLGKAITGEPLRIRLVAGR